MVKVDPTPKLKCQFGVFCFYDVAFSEISPLFDIDEGTLKELQTRIANKVPSKLVQAYNLNKHIQAIESAQLRRSSRPTSKMNVVENTNVFSSPRTPILKSKPNSPIETLQPIFDVTVH